MPTAKASRFTVRVELHSGGDYDVLHEAMENEGFSRRIQDGKSKKWLQLPTAEYVLSGKLTRKQVLKKAENAAKETKKKFWVLVTESNGRTWSGLPEATD